MKFDKSDIVMQVANGRKVAGWECEHSVYNLCNYFVNLKLFLKSWEKIVVFSHVNLELVGLSQNPLKFDSNYIDL